MATPKQSAITVAQTIPAACVHDASPLAPDRLPTAISRDNKRGRWVQSRWGVRSGAAPTSEGADLSAPPPDLGEIQLEDAHLEQVNVRLAHLKEANLSGPHFEHADFTDDHLEGAYIIDAHPRGANLTAAQLRNIFFLQVDLEDASLGNTLLENTYFRDVSDLAQKQIDSTYMDERMKPPKGPALDGHPYRRSPRTLDEYLEIEAVVRAVREAES